MGYQRPPAGWFDLGTHVDVDLPLEFSTEVGEDGLPLWERPAIANPERINNGCMIYRQDA